VKDPFNETSEFGWQPKQIKVFSDSAFQNIVDSERLGLNILRVTAFAVGCANSRK
jgi:hypothetical protein